MDPFVWGNHMELEPIPFRYRARDLREQDIAQVQAAIAAHYARGRSFIARSLCELRDWRQPNGGNKEFAARDLLLRLQETGSSSCRHASASRAMFRRRPTLRFRPTRIRGSVGRWGRYRAVGP